MSDDEIRFKPVAAPPPPPRIQAPKADKPGKPAKPGKVGEPSRAPDRLGVWCPSLDHLQRSLAVLSARLLLRSPAAVARRPPHEHLLTAPLDSVPEPSRDELVRGLRQQLDAAGLTEVRLLTGTADELTPWGREVVPAGGGWSHWPAVELLCQLTLRARPATAAPWMLVRSPLLPAIARWLAEGGHRFRWLAVGSAPDGHVLLQVTEGSPQALHFLQHLDGVSPLAERLPASGDTTPHLLLPADREPPFDLQRAPFLLEGDHLVIFRPGAPAIRVDGPGRLIPDTALLTPHLSGAGHPLRLTGGDTPEIGLPVTLVREAPHESGRQPVVALLLTRSEAEHLVRLGEHLPWAVTHRLSMVRHGDLHFVLLQEGARWELPFGLPFSGDLTSGLCLLHGWRTSPRVPPEVVRRAVGAEPGTLVWLSPACTWVLDRQAFRPLSELLVWSGAAAVRLTVQKADLTLRLVLPEVEVPPAPALPKAGAAPTAPIDPLQHARQLEDEGKLLEAAIGYERAGSHERAAALYEKAAEL